MIPQPLQPPQFYPATAEPEDRSTNSFLETVEIIGAGLGFAAIIWLVGAIGIVMVKGWMRLWSAF